MRKLNIVPSPLKQELKNRKIAIWKLCLLLNKSVSETALSRYLAGIRPLPVEVEKEIQKILQEEQEEEK